MSDDSRKGASIPSWQRAQASTPADSPQSNPATNPAAAAISTPAPTDNISQGEDKATELLEQAKKFLLDPSIRDAPVERKQAFLEAKGVAREAISKLLSAGSDGEGSSGDANVEFPEPELPSVSNSFAQTHTPTDARPQPAPRDLPPIVTYPEFLTQSTAPPPLVTKTRLMYTFYGAAALSATLYGISKYLVEPMTESLTLARHEFAEHTSGKMEDLNEKLLSIASVDPAENPHVGTSVAGIDDNSSVHSDPTELYHRDFGTQTSPPRSRRASVSSSEEDESAAKDIAITHAKRIKALTAHMNDLTDSAQDNKTASESLEKQMRDLSQYLSEMRYQTPYQFSSGFPNKTPLGAKDDAIEQFRTDIRSVKGVLLSARNFPAGGRPAARVPGRVGA